MRGLLTRTAVARNSCVSWAFLSVLATYGAGYSSVFERALNIVVWYILY